MKIILKAWLMGMLFIGASCQNGEFQVPSETKTQLVGGSTIKKKSPKANLVTKETAFHKRTAHTSFVFKNKMWLIAGNGPGYYYNDV